MTSVVIITFNRKKLLRECLHSLLFQDINEDFEIITIDNGSSDDTEEFIKKEFKDNRINFIKNKHQLNLLECKNLGLKNSSGDIIAFIDDDCLADKNWLKTARDSLEKYDFVGGVVLPTPHTKFPWWWRKSLDWLVGINTEPSKKFLPLGSNIAFNKYVLDELQKNKQNSISRNNLYLPYAEDNYRIKTALSMGFTMDINKDMVIYHCVPKERLRISYLIKRSYGEGYAWVHYEKNISNLYFLFITLPINLTRLLISLDINRLFRTIVTISYILNSIKKGWKNVTRY